jgi:molybdopterin converting factor small subunit
LVTVKVKLIGVLRRLSGTSEITLKPKRPTVRNAIEMLTESLPRDTTSLLTDSPLNTLILLNGREISVLKGLETTIKNGDELTIIPVAHGG